MKGIVFSKFIEFVEERFSPEMADDIIESSDLPSGGAYTSVGTYDHREMLQLVTALSEKSGTPVPDLVRSFGCHLFGILAGAYPQFLEGIDSSLEFLQLIENYIHVEVRKLYPDAELPTFEHCSPSANQLELIYYSKRPLGDLAHGLIEGCAGHFGDTLSIEREELLVEEGTSIRFLLTPPGVANG